MRSDPSSEPVAGAANAEEAALAAAFEAVLAPLAELAVARGLPCPTAEALMRRVWVQAANRAHAALPAHRRVSRIATSTGLSRREVTRLTMEPDEPQEAHRRSPSSEVFARWFADKAWHTAEGKPAPLARTGAAPSFEALAQSVTKDVHPRTLMEELIRLGMVKLDADTDQVELLKEAFVPRGDRLRMVELLADNTSDHLRAAVDNVLGERRAHLEQAVFADELSKDSLGALSRLMNDEWQALLSRLVPALEKLISDDSLHGRPQDQRVRIGLYSYSSNMGEPQ